MMPAPNTIMRAIEIGKNRNRNDLRSDETSDDLLSSMLGFGVSAAIISQLLLFPATA
jgi:hypothetical protein